MYADGSWWMVGCECVIYQGGKLRLGPLVLQMSQSDKLRLIDLQWFREKNQPCWQPKLQNIQHQVCWASRLHLRIIIWSAIFWFSFPVSRLGLGGFFIDWLDWSLFSLRGLCERVRVRSSTGALLFGFMEKLPERREYLGAFIGSSTS